MNPVDDNYIEINKEIFKGFESQLKKLTIKYKTLEDAETRGTLNQRWYNLCNGNYARLRRNITDFISGSSITEKLPKDNYDLLIGRISMRIVEDFVNSFELILGDLFEENGYNDQLQSEIQPLIDLVNSTEWERTAKQTIIQSIEGKKLSFAFKTKFLRNIGVLSEDDKAFLSFVWSIRNTMHSNFVNKHRIHYKLIDEEVGTEWEVDFQPNEGIYIAYTPKWTTVITERMSSILISLIELENAI